MRAHVYAGKDCLSQRAVDTHTARPLVCVWLWRGWRCVWRSFRTSLERTSANSFARILKLKATRATVCAWFFGTSSSACAASMLAAMTPPPPGHLSQMTQMHLKRLHHSCLARSELGVFGRLYRRLEVNKSCPCRCGGPSSAPVSRTTFAAKTPPI
jgi:hypothetical protein